MIKRDGAKPNLVSLVETSFGKVQVRGRLLNEGKNKLVTAGDLQSTVLLDSNQNNLYATRGTFNGLRIRFGLPKKTREIKIKEEKKGGRTFRIFP